MGQDKGMKSINELLKEYPETARLAPSPDLRKSEEFVIKCAICGKDFKGLKVTERDGKVREPPVNCSDCLQKKREEIYRQQMTEELPAEIEKQREKWWEKTEIPDNLADKICEQTWKSFDRKLQPKAFDAVKDFDGHSVILSSPDVYGVGKTHLAALLVHHLLETSEAVSITPHNTYRLHECPAHMVTETRLLARIRATYSRNSAHDNDIHYEETEEDVYNSLYRFNLLVIDDVGKVRPHDYSFLQGVYFRIIDDRYNGQKPIMLTTNLSPEDLEKHIGGACADRLKEMCGPGNFVIMKGKSYRGSEK